MFFVNNGFQRSRGYGEEMEAPRVFIGKGDDTKLCNYLSFCKHWRRILHLIPKTAQNGDDAHSRQGSL